MTNVTFAIRRWAGALKASLHMTAQERADAYVARSPLAVLAV
ncbi:MULTISPECIES: hypothetical protein [unclassified Mycobacterium]|nr:MULTISPECIES: hypothetical protein [unclassified Mycobacterium]MDP7704579.1 hypothetical protein [Mycobacterium sp. TY815]MDP7723368.1 hypothetical protein [Mycobacterium sp. TY814]